MTTETTTNLDHPLAVTDATWKTEVLESSLPVVVDFWAPWCGPCRMVAPVLEQLAKERAGQVKIVKLNTDEHQRTAGNYGIRSIPTMMLFKDGQIVDVAIGAKPKPQLDEWLDQHL